MNKKFLMILLVISAVTASAFGLTACSKADSSGNENPGVSKTDKNPEVTIESEIKTAYYTIHKEEFDSASCTADDIKITFYGEYGGSYAMFIDSIYDYPQALYSETIDGVVLHYCDYQTLDVYNNGEIYTVQGAFEKGLLTHDDLLEIAYNLETFGRFLEN